jgi:TolB-like protein
MRVTPTTRFALIAALLVAAAAARADAQEFTQQTLVVAPLHSVGSPRTARAVASSLRSRIARLSNRRELHVLDGDTTEDVLQYSGYRADTVLSEVETRILAKRLRADEVVVGTVESRAGAVEVRAQLVLTRDWRMRQPLPFAHAATAAAAADTVARYVASARTQMTGTRRCENAARAGDHAAAARYAEEAIRNYPASTLARTCLAIVLRFNDAGADSIAHVSEAIIALDSSSVVAAVIRANSLSALESSAAPDAWKHVLRLRSDSLELALVATEELLRLRRPAMALDAARTLIRLHEGDQRIRRLEFRAYAAMSAWKDAAALGDSLDADDVDFRDDSSYAIRHVEALKTIGDTLGALAKSARSVRLHPGDLQLYLQYVRLVNGENGAALPRGLALFPGSSDLHVLAARSAIAGGKKHDAIASLAAAVGADSSLTQGYLQMAELWFDEQQPDSAIAIIGRTPRSGPNAELLRTYAIARGRQFTRSALDTSLTTWHRALTLFFLADSVESRDDSRGVIAATSLQLARGALLLASKSRDCQNSNRANETLALTATMLERGVGDGPSANELHDVFGAMRSATDNALRLYCTTPKIPQ